MKTIVETENALKKVFLLTNQNLQVFIFNFFNMSSLFINTYYTGKLIDVGLKRQMVDLLPTIFFSIIMGGTVFVVANLFCSPYIQICLGVLTGIVVYYVVSIAFRSKDLQYLKIVLSNNLLKR